ncbi:MAG TPA: hypothetical protein VLR26_04900 [Frankiaceae bacterium]|nr:hypothetical protein [Frankiaceae bacterium]
MIEARRLTKRYGEKVTAVCLFGAASAVLLGISAGAVPVDQRQVGVGFFLSGGLVAALVAMAYAGSFVARLRAVERVPRQT